MINGDHRLRAKVIDERLHTLVLDQISGEKDEYQLKLDLATVLLDLKYLYADLEMIWRKA